MSDIEADWEGEDENVERPYGGRPYGGRPYGGRPYGGRPYGARPYGGRPYGGRPYGGRLLEVERPYGGRPYGGRPYGGRPYGGRPYGGRPYGGRPYGGRRSADGGIDLDEWADDIAELFCARSALVQAGATVASVDDQLWLPADVSVGGFRPIALPAGPVAPLQLEPCDHTVEAVVATPTALFPHIADDPGLAVSVKADLGEELVRAADAAMLGPNPPLPGISTRAAIQVGAAGDVLQTLRDMLVAVFGGAPRPAFRTAGWILHPLTVAHLSGARTLDGQTESNAASARPLAEFDLLRLESAYGGMLLGLPFVTSAEAVAAPGPPPQPRIFLSADWDEAWIGVDPSLVKIDLPGNAAVAGARVVRASLSVDFELRREPAFAWADSP